jgi:hypothetical protein
MLGAGVCPQVNQQALVERASREYKSTNSVIPVTHLASSSLLLWLIERSRSTRGNMNLAYFDFKQAHTARSAQHIAKLKKLAGANGI